MEGRFNFKAILVGFIVDTFSSAVLSVIFGLLVGTTRMVSTPAANAVAVNAQMAAQMNSPLGLLGTILTGVIGALLGGYVSGVLAPGAEIKTAAATGVFSVVAFALLWALVSRGGGAAVPAWVTLTAFLLTIPATVGGGALRALKTAPLYASDNSSSDQY